MEKENEKELNLDEGLEEPKEDLDEDGQDKTDWKAAALNRHGRLKRAITDLKGYREKEAKAETEEKTKSETEQPQDKKEFDYTEMSYLLASGIKEEEFSFVWEEHQRSKESVRDLLKLDYFQDKLKKKRELDETDTAVPLESKRGGGSARDEVDYWLTKGELPPIDQVELRRKVVNARIEKEKAASKFTSKPIV